MTDTLLIIEDERLLGAELRRQLVRGGWEAVWVQSLAEARASLAAGVDPLVVLSDMSLPDGNALDLLESARSERPATEWIFLSGHGTIPDSVRALRLGAYEFLTKPCEPARLELVINAASRGARAQRRIQDEAMASASRYSPEAFIGPSGPAAAVRALLGRLVQLPVRDLVITGETGTGKGLAARILHHSSPRAAGPMVEINCAALPRELLESELFGHEAGAFTGARGRRRGLIEQADGGTLFLDEIGEMDIALQAKLLKVLEDRSYRRLGGEREIEADVRIISASNCDLPSLVEKRAFRADLYHRLNVFRLHLPPLRERLEDLDALVPAFVEEFNHDAGRRIRVIPDAIWQQLRAYHWPGNVRELRNVLDRCVLLSSGEILDGRWLQLSGAADEQMPGAAATASGGDRLYLPMDGSMALEDMDRHIIETALQRHAYNVTAAARALGATRETLRYRVRKYGLSPAEPETSEEADAG